MIFIVSSLGYGSVPVNKNAADMLEEHVCLSLKPW
jgi:hypothetical protein